MNTNEFIEKMSRDEALAKKMECCKAPEEAYEVAKEAGLTDDFETFKAVMTAVYNQLKGELSDGELENVAGGMSEAAASGIAFAATTGIVAAGMGIVYAAAGA
ncbi:MAG: Nif11-like leader peptide family RiPP precursor [Oscillospiraceae bacterium]